MDKNISKSLDFRHFVDIVPEFKNILYYLYSRKQTYTSYEFHKTHVFVNSIMKYHTNLVTIIRWFLFRQKMDKYMDMMLHNCFRMRLKMVKSTEQDIIQDEKDIDIIFEEYDPDVNYIPENQTSIWEKLRKFDDDFFDKAFIDKRLTAKDCGNISVQLNLHPFLICGHVTSKRRRAKKNIYILKNPKIKNGKGMQKNSEKNSTSSDGNVESLSQREIVLSSSDREFEHNCEHLGTGNFNIDTYTNIEQHEQYEKSDDEASKIENPNLSEEENNKIPILILLPEEKESQTRNFSGTNNSEMCEISINSMYNMSASCNIFENDLVD